MPPIKGAINSNPYEAGVGRTDHQIGPLWVAVTTGTATNRCVNRLDHLSSLSSDTATLVGMLFGSLCLPTGWHNCIYHNGMGAACNPA